MAAPTAAPSSPSASAAPVAKIVAYPYRWIVLGAFMLVMAVQQLTWISFAPITSRAMAFYGQSEISIGLLSMVFMIVYLVVSFPASWVIDTWGLRAGVGIGAVLTGVFALLRGLLATNFAWVMVAQIGIAVGQPFILNAVAKVASRWFPLKERATASGLAWLMGYLGLIAGFAVTPMLVPTEDGAGIPSMLMIYGIVSAVACGLFLLFGREKPRTPQGSPEEEVRALVFDGLKSMVKQRDFVLFNLIFFIGLGVFNGVSTWIEQILKPRGISSEDAGLIGAAMVVMGVVGSAVIPMLSDRFRNRTKIILVALAGCVPGLLGFTLFHSVGWLIASAAVLGFFMLSTAPVGFQYCAEVGHPAPEGTSTGVLMSMGQFSGILFIYAMDWLKDPKTGSMTLPLIGLVVLMVVAVVISLFLKESKLLTQSRDVVETEAQAEAEARAESAPPSP